MILLLHALCVKNTLEYAIIDIITQFYSGENFSPFPGLTPLSTPSLTRNSSGDEIANVNFLYDDIVHVLQNTTGPIDSCINSATDRHGYVLERLFTKFSEITQCNGHYAVQGNSRSLILVPIESTYTTSY